eukprot:Nk52_evm37s236 gene=Nk52_evmTU37s236
MLSSVVKSTSVSAQVAAKPVVAGIISRAYATNGHVSVPKVDNEPMPTYAKGTVERDQLIAALKEMKGECPDVPIVIGGEEIRSGEKQTQTMASDHQHALCTFYHADRNTLQKAVTNSLAAKEKWMKTSPEFRAGILLKAADLLSGKYRPKLMAATMLGQGKTVIQGEIDAPAETCDFWRFNSHFALDIYKTQPQHHSKGVWNRLDYRPLEGFVLAVCPFNFTAIGGNLPTAPAVMGNVALWKPSDTAVLSNYYLFQILREAGLPDGVINFVPGKGPDFDAAVTVHPDLGGVHFTGSANTFNHIQKVVANNIENYKIYPRVVGETGGKNFHMIHKTADVDSVVNGTIRGAFEYQGQKCSATSRIYVPQSLWPEIKTKLVERTKALKQGQVDDFSSFVSAVIDKAAFTRISGYLEHAKNSPGCKVLCGGNADDSVGWFVEPTIVEVDDPKDKLMQEEIFGPVLAAYVYPDEKFEEMCKVCDETSPYALTGAVFAKDKYAMEVASDLLRNSCGNFYQNDKSTGSIVGQQPFGGSRKSGTNDKAGAPINVMRWVSVRSIKETFVPLDTIEYPYMH